MRFVWVNKTVNLPAGTVGSPSSTVVDLSDDLDKSISALVTVYMGYYNLPYVLASGSIGTWVERVSGKTVTIKNSATAWNNYSFYALVMLSE